MEGVPGTFSRRKESQTPVSRTRFAVTDLWSAALNLTITAIAPSALGRTCHLRHSSLPHRTGLLHRCEECPRWQSPSPVVSGTPFRLGGRPPFDRAARSLSPRTLMLTALIGRCWGANGDPEGRRWGRRLRQRPRQQVLGAASWGRCRAMWSSWFNTTTVSAGLRRRRLGFCRPSWPGREPDPLLESPRPRLIVASRWQRRQS